MANKAVKKKSAGTVIAQILAALLIIALLLGTGYGIGCAVTGNADVRQWVTKQEKPDDPDEPNKNDPATPDDVDKKITSSGFVVTSAAYSGAVRLAASSVVDGEVLAPEGSYTITATITPADADIQTLDWSVVGFSNANSAWAKGKNATDYVTITPTSDGALTAVAKCLLPFGEPIKIRATSRDNPDIYADCTCDYVKRVASVTLSNSSLDFPSSPYSYSVQYSDYTIDTNIVIAIGNSLKFADGFIDEIMNRVKTAAASSSSSLRNLYNNGDIWAVMAGQRSTTLTTDYNAHTISVRTNSFADLGMINIISEDFESDIPQAKVELNNLFRQTVSSYQGTMASFDITWTSEYKGTVFSAGTKTVEVRFNYASIKVEIEKVTIPGNIVF